MSAAATPNPTAQPDANPVADKGSRAGRLLDLVRKLIDYGKEIAGTLRERASTGLGFDAFRFGTRDLTLILARITRGLHLATALEERVLQNAARLDAEPAASPAPSRHRPRAAQPAARRAPEADTLLAHLPTPEQIAAEVRRRPIGAVIAEICHDLGIMPRPSAMARIAVRHHPIRRQPRPPGEGHPRAGVSATGHRAFRISGTAASIPGTCLHRPALTCRSDRQAPCTGPALRRSRRSRFYDRDRQSVPVT